MGLHCLGRPKAIGKFNILMRTIQKISEFSEDFRTIQNSIQKTWTIFKNLLMQELLTFFCGILMRERNIRYKCVRIKNVEKCLFVQI